MKDDTKPTTHKMFRNGRPTERFEKVLQETNEFSNKVIELVRNYVEKDWNRFTIQVDATGNRRKLTIMNISMKKRKI
jgi:hypothetical protein